VEGDVTNLGKRHLDFFLQISIESGQHFATSYHRIGVYQNDG
jgi:hypothetical protein